MTALSGKVALVTGGGSGIGLATVKRLSEAGAHVILADVNTNAAATAREIGATFQALDVGDPANWQAVCDAVSAEYGSLDIAYLNAGIMSLPPNERGIQRVDITTLPESNYRRVMSVNIDGVYFGVQHVVPLMQNGGAIVATSSLAGLLAYPTDAVYAATKHFVIGLVRSLARVLAKSDITINAVCPGAVATQIVGSEAAIGGMRERGVDFMDPSVIADAVVHAITSGKTGVAYMCQHGRPPEPYSFGKVPGID